MVSFQHSINDEFFAHWLSLRRDGFVPSTEHFLDNPSARLIPKVMIVELVEDDLLIRFHGTSLVTRRHKDLTGTKLMESDGEAKKVAIANLRILLDHPCGLLSTNSFTTSTDRSVAVEALTLPLSVTPGRPQRIVSVSEMLEQPDRGEHSRNWITVQDAQWVDIGAGIPDNAPTPWKSDKSGKR